MKIKQQARIAKTKVPFGGSFSTRLAKVNSKLTCTLSCGSDGDRSCHAAN